MMLIDETRLTYGTLQMIGQDYGVEGHPLYDKDYADKVVEACKKDLEEFKKELKYLIGKKMIEIIKGEL